MIQSGIASIDFLQIQNIEYSYLKDAGRDTMPFDRCNSQADLPIIIDYGSNTFKAGWGSSTMPDIVVRSIINRTKDNKSTIVVGTAGKEVDIFKSNFQSPYERNLLYHQGAFEHLNDYLFSELRAGSGNEIGHPLIITEPCANTKNQRQSMMECLFEGYGAPSVMVGIDALWSVFSDLNTFLS
jgi:actin-related protein